MASSQLQVIRTVALSSQSCGGARPGSGSAMKSPNRIFFALELGCFPFFFFFSFLHLAKETKSWKILHSSHPTEGSSGLSLGRGAWVPKGPRAERAMVTLALHGLGYEWKCCSELPGAFDFFWDQSCEVKGGGSISNEDGDGGKEASRFC